MHRKAIGIVSAVAIMASACGTEYRDERLGWRRGTASNSDQGAATLVGAPAAPRVLFTIATNASAHGYPVTQAIDNRPGTIWLASRTVSSANNNAWVELTLTSTTYVSNLRWTSPKSTKADAFYPANGPSNLKVTVTSDGTTWTDVHQSEGSPMRDGQLEIGRPIRKLRLDVSKVNDGTGWALAFSEIWLEGLAGVAKSCTLVLGPQDDYKKALKSLGAGPKTVCLKGGNYAGPIRVEGASDVEIVAHEGIPVITSRTDVNSTLDRATFQIFNSRNVTLNGLTIRNTYQVSSPSVAEGYKYISRALAISTSSNVQIQNSTLYSNGKQTAHLDGGSHSFRNTFFKGFYFLIDTLNGASVTVNKATLYTDFTTYSNDAHSVIWVTNSDLSFTDLSVIAKTGRGFLSGDTTSGSPKGSAKLFGTTKVSSLKEWMQVHPNYRNQKLELHGSYPKLTSFFFNPYKGGGKAVGSSLCFYGQTESLIQCE